MPNLTPAGSYTVRLDFAEIYWTAAGQRLFNVSINGQQVLTNFDIFATAGGKDIAIAETFTATANSVRPNRHHVHLGQGQRQGQRYRDHGNCARSPPRLRLA